MKLRKVLSGVIALGMIILCLSSMTALATPAKLTEAYDDFVYMPVKSGAEAAALFGKANETDTTIISTGEDNSATITFPAGTETEGVVTRTATSVFVDMSPVYEKRYSYISFDLTANDLMDLVATLDDPSSTGNERPLSLYLTDTGAMAGMPHSQKNNYAADAGTKITTLKNAMTTGWYYNNKYTVKYNPAEKHNVKMVHDLYTNQVWVYIDGIMRGEIKYTTPQKGSSNGYHKWKRNLIITHYATKAEAQSITFENIEVGTCDEMGYLAGAVVGTNTDGVYWFPTSNTAVCSDRVFIRLTLPAGTDRYVVEADGAGMAWCGSDEFGACHNWNYKTIQTSRTYANVNSWGNASCWQQNGKDTVVVTFDYDKANDIIRVFTNNGGYYEATPAANTNRVIITSEKQTVGEGEEAVEKNVVQPISVEYGAVLPIGLNIANTTENETSCTVVDSFDDTTTGRLNVMTFGKTESNKKLVALYAWYNEDDICIKADTREITADVNGLYYLSGEAYGSAPIFGSEIPEGATKMKAYIWDGIGTLRPVWKDAEIVKTVAEEE